MRALLTDQRRAERLLCRYLADLAERVRGRSDPELGAYADELHAARCCFGLGVRQTRERLRVGFALRTLPAIERAFVDGDLSYSRVREVTRVATTETELQWLELAQRLDMRGLERRVAGAEEAARMAAGSMTTTAAFQCMEQQRRGVGDPARGVGRQPHRELPAGPAPAAPRSRQSQGTHRLRPNESRCSGAAPATSVGAAPATSVRASSTAEGIGGMLALGAGARGDGHARAEWRTPSSVRVTVELSAEAWALLERAMQGARDASGAGMSDGEAGSALRFEHLD